jgi:hypothetical protein
MMGDWKGYDHYTVNGKLHFFTDLHMSLLHTARGYKSTSWRTRRMHTHSSDTMASQQPEPWTPRWVREKHRERKNDLPPNDPNRDNKPPAGADPPLCKCKLKCHCYYSLDYDMYGRRYWGCWLPILPFNLGWDKELPRNEVSALTLKWLLIMS